MKYTSAQLKIVRELPLRKDVVWLDLSQLFSGMICEKMKRKSGEAAGKWPSVDIGCSDTAARIVEIHNDWLSRKTKKDESNDLANSGVNRAN